MAEVAAELGVSKGLVGRWVERRWLDASIVGDRSEPYAVRVNALALYLALEDHRVLVSLAKSRASSGRGRRVEQGPREMRAERMREVARAPRAQR